MEDLALFKGFSIFVANPAPDGMSSSNGVIRKTYQNADNKGETVWSGRKFKGVAAGLNGMGSDDNDFAVAGLDV